MLSLKFASPVLACMYSSTGSIDIVVLVGWRGLPALVRAGQAAILGRVELDGAVVGAGAAAAREPRHKQRRQERSADDEGAGEREREEEQRRQRQAREQQQPQRQGPSPDEHARLAHAGFSSLISTT